MHANHMFAFLTEAGIIRKDDYVRRVVIDVQVGNAVVIHVERYGDDRLLEVIRKLDGIEVSTAPRRLPHIYCGPCNLEFAEHQDLFDHVHERHAAEGAASERT